MQQFPAAYAKPVAAIALMLCAWQAARLPQISDDERVELAGQFAFHASTLPTVTGAEARGVRPVHPSLEKISAWISSVGAAVALHDIDGDGLSNDVCYVDTRTDQVIVAPTPGSADRYQPFELQPGGELYDRSTMAPMGCIPSDLNEDGLLDVLVYYWGRPPIAFLRRGGDRQRRPPAADEYAALSVGRSSERWFTNAATRADVDGDGHVDLIIGNYFPDGARILDAAASGTEQMQHSMSRAFNGGTNRILLWKAGVGGSQPSVNFAEAADAWSNLTPEVATGWTLALGAADLDGDQLPEFYVGNDFGPDRLLHNRSRPGAVRFALLHGRRTLTTPASKVLGHDSFKGMGVDFGDVNADGVLDIYVSNIAAEYALEESHFLFVSDGPVELMQQGVAPYVEQSEALGVSRSGWGWDSRLADFNNDGVLEAIQATGFAKGEANRWPELHEIAMGNDQLLSRPDCWHRFQPGDDLSGSDHNPLFVRAGDGRFYDVAPELGIDLPQVTRGIATADVDGDGDLDFAAANQWGASRLYENRASPAGAFLGLRLTLPIVADASSALHVESGLKPADGELRPAIGAAATVTCPDGRSLVGQVDGGNGHSGARSPELHFGLGQVGEDEIVRVEVKWRDAAGVRRSVVMELPPGWHTVVLGAAQVNETEVLQVAKRP